MKLLIIKIKNIFAKIGNIIITIITTALLPFFDIFQDVFKKNKRYI